MKIRPHEDVTIWLLSTCFHPWKGVFKIRSEMWMYCIFSMYLYLCFGNWIQNVVSQLIWKMYEQLVFRLNPTSKFLAWHFICCNMLSLPSEVSFQSNHQINYFVSDSHRQIFFWKTKVGNFEILQSKRVQWSNGTFDTSSNFEKRHPSNVRPQWKFIPHCEVL